METNFVLIFEHTANSSCSGKLSVARLVWLASPSTRKDGGGGAGQPDYCMAERHHFILRHNASKRLTDFVCAMGDIEAF